MVRVVPGGMSGGRRWPGKNGHRRWWVVSWSVERVSRSFSGSGCVQMAFPRAVVSAGPMAGNKGRVGAR